jgi:DNA replication licensing factor MCM2
LLAFLLGNLIKLKVREHQLRYHEQPENVIVKLSELEDKVRYFCARSFKEKNTHHQISQAKEHDIFDIKPFLRSKLFTTNGYLLGDKVIEKHFRMD